MELKGQSTCEWYNVKIFIFVSPKACYFGVMKIEILWDNTPAPTPPPLPTLLASLHPLWARAQAFARKAWYPTLNVCWLWLFRFLFDYSLQLNVNNNNKQINSHKFPIISHSISGIVGPSIKTPLFSIFFSSWHTVRRTMILKRAEELIAPLHITITERFPKASLWTS